MKKVVCIVKVDSDRFLKYEYVSDLIRFTAFLDSKYNWRYFNVFDRSKGVQIASYTKNKRPDKKLPF
jgi:hypothetical protein